MNRNDFDFDVIDPTARPAMKLTFPVVQWRNGDPKLKKYSETMAYRGGFFFPFDACGEGTLIEGWGPESFTGSDASGSEIEGLYARRALVTLVRSRRRWQSKDGGRLVVRTWTDYIPDASLQGKMQAVGFIAGYPDPVQFTFNGTAINWITEAQRDHYARVVMGVANKTAPKGQGLPHYALYMPIKAASFITAGKGSKTKEITPPMLDLSKTPTLDEARSWYVGRERLIASQELYHELEEWAHEWDHFEAPRQSAAAAYLNANPDEFPGRPPRIEEFVSESEPVMDDYTPDF